MPQAYTCLLFRTATINDDGEDVDVKEDEEGGDNDDGSDDGNDDEGNDDDNDDDDDDDEVATASAICR